MILVFHLSSPTLINNLKVKPGFLTIVNLCKDAHNVQYYNIYCLHEAIIEGAPCLSSAWWALNKSIEGPPCRHQQGRWFVPGFTKAAALLPDSATVGLLSTLKPCEVITSHLGPTEDNTLSQTYCSTTWQKGHPISWCHRAWHSSKVFTPLSCSTEVIRSDTCIHSSSENCVPHRHLMCRVAHDYYSLSH